MFDDLSLLRSFGLGYKIHICKGYVKSYDVKYCHIQSCMEFWGHVKYVNSLGWVIDVSMIPWW